MTSPTAWRFGSQDAVDAGLLDGLLYEDELHDLLESKLDGEDLDMISLGEYTLEERFLGGQRPLRRSWRN